MLIRAFAAWIGTVLLLWAGGLVWFVHSFATPIAEPAAATDAIVVLTGGSLRLESGLELLREGKGHMLFVSGVNQQVELADLLPIAGAHPDWITCCVVLGHEADNTLGNARETALWMGRHGYRSLRLVTAWYHMPRSLLEFERALPGTDIIPHPVFPEVVKHEGWWESPGTAALLIGEYGKYLAALFRPLLMRLQPNVAEPQPR
jgi:uncharacterized SAM-binding protein YcdF (DUF218 family)